MHYAVHKARLMRSGAESVRMTNERSIGSEEDRSKRAHHLARRAAASVRITTARQSAESVTRP